MLRRALVFLGLAGLAACAEAPADDTSTSSEAVSAHVKVQANDVSFLFPLGDGLLTPDDLGRGGALLPADVYGKASAEGEGGIPGVERSRLRLVSMRLDPCFATLKPIAETPVCENQLRVVFQPPGEDAAVHALYAISREELTSAVRAILRLRGDADLGPLGVHPLVKKEGLGGSTYAALKAIILANAGKANLVRFTLVSTSALGSAWNFRGFDVKDGVSTPVEIPALPAGTKTVAFFRGFAKDQVGGDLHPVTTSADDLSLFADASKARRATTERQRAALDALRNVEDPARHSPNTIDCASCHAAQPLRALVGERLLGVESEPLAGETSPKTAADISVHMFSYMGKTPSIHRRTVTETATIAAYLSTQL